jgi:protein-L-isoaspartate(D-aspartate) O-methyltransferase
VIDYNGDVRACELREKDSLYLAAGSDAASLLAEHQLRRRAGLPGEFLDHARLHDAFAILRAGALISPGAADADPLQLSRGLLRVAVARGARLFDSEATAFDASGRAVTVGLDNGREIEAKSVVLATGYVMPGIVHSDVHRVSSSWAMATAPQPRNIWKDGALIWEDSEQYHYLRTTRVGRIIIGGEDSDEIVEPDTRDRLIPEKSRVLEAIGRVPRELFVPAELRRRAYDDRALPIGHGQTISQPFMVAAICAALDLEGDERVLDVGTGSGYQAAVLAELAAEVVTIERVAALAERARRTLAAAGYERVEVRVGDGTLGVPERAPFDGIAVAAAAPSVPEALYAQLAPAGRVVVPVGSRRDQQLEIVIRGPHGREERTSVPCRFVPLVGEAGFAEHPAW